jgi:hypothetical protein
VRVLVLEQINESISAEMLIVVEKVRSMAKEHQDDPIKLLAILRLLEHLHNDICEELFQPALPNTRHGLFDLLRDIESSGGWPHIYRIGLQELFQNLDESITNQQSPTNN